MSLLPLSSLHALKPFTLPWMFVGSCNRIRDPNEVLCPWGPHHHPVGEMRYQCAASDRVAHSFDDNDCVSASLADYLDTGATVAESVEYKVVEVSDWRLVIDFFETHKHYRRVAIIASRPCITVASAAEYGGPHDHVLHSKTHRFWLYVKCPKCGISTYSDDDQDHQEWLLGDCTRHKEWISRGEPSIMCAHPRTGEPALASDYEHQWLQQLVKEGNHPTILTSTRVHVCDRYSTQHHLMLITATDYSQKKSGMDWIIPWSSRAPQLVQSVSGLVASRPHHAYTLYIPGRNVSSSSSYSIGSGSGHASSSTWFPQYGLQTWSGRRNCCRLRDTSKVWCPTTEHLHFPGTMQYQCAASNRLASSWEDEECVSEVMAHQFADSEVIGLTDWNEVVKFFETFKHYRRVAIAASRPSIHIGWRTATASEFTIHYSYHQFWLYIKCPKCGIYTSSSKDERGDDDHYWTSTDVEWISGGQPSVTCANPRTAQPALASECEDQWFQVVDWEHDTDNKEDRRDRFNHSVIVAHMRWEQNLDPGRELDDMSVASGHAVGSRSIRVRAAPRYDLPLTTWIASSKRAYTLYVPAMTLSTSVSSLSSSSPLEQT